MSEEKTTGVCVDIPTVIKEAKAKKQCDQSDIFITEDGACSNCNRSDAFTEAWFCSSCQGVYKHNSTGWISVAERLPKAKTPVLVFSQLEVFCAEYDPGHWRDTQWSIYIDGGPAHGVTHWMPLPEPPKHP